MILTDREITVLIENKGLTFNPLLEASQIKASAIDLRLGYNFSVYPYDTSGLPESVRSMFSQTVDLRDESKVVEFIGYLRHQNNKTLQDGESIEIQPRSLLLAETLEDFNLPNNIAASTTSR